MLIPLTRGQFAVIDDEDYELVSAYSWRYRPPTKGCSAYAVTSARRPDGSWDDNLTMHRLILQPSEGFLPDHKNRDGLDNRRCNLRPATQSQNLCNRRQPPNKWGFRGVGQHGLKYRADCKYEKRVYRSKLFATPQEAAREYDRMVSELHGEFAVLNFPDEA